MQDLKMSKMVYKYLRIMKIGQWTVINFVPAKRFGNALLEKLYAMLKQILVELLMI